MYAASYKKHCCQITLTVTNTETGNNASVLVEDNNYKAAYKVACSFVRHFDNSYPTRFIQEENGVTGEISYRPIYAE